MGATVEFLNRWAAQSSASAYVIGAVAIYAMWVLLGAASLLGLAELLRQPWSGLRMAIAGGVALLLALGCAGIASTLWYEPRPFVADPAVHLLITHAVDSSFPSDHVAVAAAAATVTSMWYRRFLVPAALGVLLLAVARVASGVHYPQDVAAAALLGITAGLLGAAIGVSIPLGTRSRPA